jgi:hypothetical protein
MEESKIFGISVRSFLAMILTMTACSMSLLEIKIVEPFYSAFLLALGFFFGQKTQTTGGVK